LKNSAIHLDAVLKNVEKISSLFEMVSYVFIENDSEDETKRMMKNWGQGRDRFYFYSIDGLDSAEKSRTIRLEIARNAYVHIIKNVEFLSHSDVMILLDMDDVSVHPINTTEFKKALDFLNVKEAIAGVFANQQPAYYDIWALRHPQLCDGDFWHKVLIKTLETNNDILAFDSVYESIVKFIPQTFDPIRVESAFGGLGIYKMKFVVNNMFRYLGSDYLFIEKNNVSFTKIQTCEHVNFNLGINALGGELYILPWLINSNQLFQPNKFAHRSLIIK
jgi:hypothetical protein